jgi:hypothetical protein
MKKSKEIERAFLKQVLFLEIARISPIEAQFAIIAFAAT